MTREEAIKHGKEQLELYDFEDGIFEPVGLVYVEFIKIAIQALEQEPILDKMRSEIEQEYTRFRNKSDMWNERACGLGMALEIIDKYKNKTESEVEYE